MRWCLVVVVGALRMVAGVVLVPPRPVVAAPSVETRRDPTRLAARTAGVYCGEAAARKFVARMPTLRSWAGWYRAPEFLDNGHAHTIWAAKLRRTAAATYARDLFATADGGTLALDVATGFDEAATGATYAAPAEPVRDGKPFLLLLSGLGGGSADSYVRAMARAATARGWRAAVLNMRSCGGSPVSSPRFFSARHGAVGDVAAAVARVRDAWAPPTVAAVGWSNSGTIVVNALSDGLDVDAACAIAAPLDMPLSSKNLERPFHRAVYDRSIGGSLASKFRGARRLFLGEDGAPKAVPRGRGGGTFVCDVARAAEATTIRQIDDALTAPCFGFGTVDAYYADASADQRVAAVDAPLLVLNAADDPIARFAAKPGVFDGAALAANPNVVFACTARGGHLGWCDAADPTGAPAWVQRTALDFLDAAAATTDDCLDGAA